MTQRPRSFGVLALTAALLVAVACTSADEGLGPSQTTATQPSSPLLADLSLQDLHLLTCSAQPYASKTQTVGSAGGTILIGTHRLTIPAGALATPVKITAEQVTGSVNSVRFKPDGLKFAKPATLTLSYANCSPLLLLKRVVYTNERLGILELVPSLDDLRAKKVSAPIRHFSRYAVAW